MSEGAPPADRRAHRAWLGSLVWPPQRGLVADLGCGRGEELRLLAERCSAPDVRLVGIDSAGEAVAAASAATASDARVSVRRATLESGVPFDDASVEVVYSHNLLECLSDAGAFAHEVARVLRPGGQLVIAHWDWDSQLFDATDKALVRRLVAAYADWQQGWMAHADGWMGRRLWGVFDSTGAFEGTVHARVLTNTAFAPGWFGHENAHALGALVRRGLVPAEDHEQFLREQEELAASGRYFYAITGFAYVGRRKPRFPLIRSC